MDTQASRMFEEYFAEAMVGRRGEEYKIDRAPIFAGTDFVSVQVHSQLSASYTPFFKR